MLTCLKCMKIDQPEIFVVERISTAPLCDVHGVAMINLVERVPFVPTEEQLEDYAQAQAEPEPEAVDTAEVFKDVIQPKEETEDMPSFEEIDAMTKDELLTLSSKMNISVTRSMNKDSIVEGIKAVLMNP